MPLHRPPTTTVTATILRHHHHQQRTFIAVRVKWVRDPHLDKAVSKEKNLKQALSLKNQIISFIKMTKRPLPLSSLKPTPHKFFQNYPSLFTLYQPLPSSPLHIKLTPQALTLHKEEQEVHSSPENRDGTVSRLAKLLMITRVGALPLSVIDSFKLDLGLSHDYVSTLLSDYPEYFCVSEGRDWVLDKDVLFLKLVSWRDDLAVSQLELRATGGDVRNVKKGSRIAFSMSFPSGFDLVKKVKEWVFQWQGLPYVSPYENAFHLDPNGDHGEKWTVAVLHEVLWLLLSKKTKKENLMLLGQYLGFGDRFKKVLRHHPGIFYVSNKIRTQTVILREAYRKDFLHVKHPLMGMRFRYIYLMNKDREKGKRSDGSFSYSRSKKRVHLSTDNSGKTKMKNKSEEHVERELNGSSDSEPEFIDSSESELEDADNEVAMKVESEQYMF